MPSTWKASNNRVLTKAWTRWKEAYQMKIIPLTTASLMALTLMKTFGPLRQVLPIRKDMASPALLIYARIQ